MNLEGVFPPMATPFDGGNVDAPSIRSNIERWIGAGVRGIVALGSNGEAPLLTDDESDRVVRAARTAVPPSHVLIAGAGRESTPATIDAARRAASLGADAVLVRTPSYYKARMTHDAFVRHYTAVADASPVPVLLYNSPAVTGVNLAPETVAELARHPNVVGIKETGSDAAQVAAYVDLTPPPPAFTVIAGSVPTCYASLCLGARAAILAAACVVPEVCVRLYEDARVGRHDAARRLQAQLTPLARLVTTVFGVPGLKAAMDLAGFVGGTPRLPLLPLDQAGVEQIRMELNRLVSATGLGERGQGNRAGNP
jgi:4-hydroxy-2-oxoglutarate aldolase